MDYLKPTSHCEKVRRGSAGVRSEFRNVAPAVSLTCEKYMAGTTDIVIVLLNVCEEDILVISSLISCQ